ncbi:MAG: hypothetical protein SGJ27_00885 [Candidatus Melainabacteria bacterium]|nr:hypothetical protein [Candidatus Melainabacteria bacterium]
MSYGGQDNTEPSNTEPSNLDEQNAQSQELIDMVHTKRGITPGQEPEQMVPRRPTRITHHEIKAMKVTVRKESSPVVGLLRKIEGMCNGMLQAIGSLFASRQSKSNPCALNGHTFPKAWKGDFPRCSHCSAVIRSPEEIHPGQNKPG